VGAVLLAWPRADGDWKPYLREVRACYQRLLTALTALVPVLLLPVLPLPAPMVPVFEPGAVLEGGVSTPALSAPGYVVPLWASTTPQEAVKARLASEVRKRGDRIMSGTP